MGNTVQVTTTDQVLVTEVSAQAIELQAPTAPATVEIQTQGPQGVAGPSAPFSSLSDVDATGKVDKSVVYYDSASSKNKVDNIYTVLTLTDGGAF